MQGNTTADILRDAERLRALLGITAWAVSGHSWGATLAVLYAKYARQATLRLVIASLFGARPTDQVWSFEGVARFFPEAVAALRALCPDTPENLPLGQRMARLMASGSDAERTELAYRMSVLGEGCCMMAPQPVERSAITPEKVQKLSVLLAYAAADFFLPEGGGVFDGLEVLRDLPITLVHGRFDFDCPPETAFQLKALLPQTNLVMVQGSHSLREPAMGAAFQDAARRLAEGS
jgi:proline iminopeptidase